MEQSEYIAALDLGTSKMVLMAATQKNGVLSILGTQKTASGNSIRRGTIYNIEEAAEKIASLVKDLNSSLRPGIKKVYVGIGGQSLRSEYYTIYRELGEDDETITDEIVDSLQKECRKYVPELAENSGIASTEYYLDGRPETSPTGIHCHNIEAKFQLILGRPSLKRSVIESMKKAGVEIAGFFVSPLATAEAVLSTKEKKLGCALVEFGAGITYLSIYKDGLLKYLVAIPLGGNVITKDICSLKILETDAEERKIREGNALLEAGNADQFDIIVESRMSEIVANVRKQIELSGYESDLAEGIIITGGGSLLKNVERLIAQQTGKQVRRANADDPTEACVRGLLLLGNENCAEEIPVIEQPNPTSLEELFGVPTQNTEKKQQKEKRKDPKKPGLLDMLKDKMVNAGTTLFSE
ncbi:cell division protein FtsA [Bacteroidia bacterium]|nr:cell division protein FtsA [Bacteroidia bacterium]